MSAQGNSLAFPSWENCSRTNGSCEESHAVDQVKCGSASPISFSGRDICRCKIRCADTTFAKYIAQSRDHESHDTFPLSRKIWDSTGNKKLNRPWQFGLRWSGSLGRCGANPRPTRAPCKSHWTCISAFKISIKYPAG